MENDGFKKNKRSLKEKNNRTNAEADCYLAKEKGCGVDYCNILSFTYHTLTFLTETSCISVPALWTTF